MKDCHDCQRFIVKHIINSVTARKKTKNRAIKFLRTIDTDGGYFLNKLYLRLKLGKVFVGLPFSPLLRRIAANVFDILSGFRSKKNLTHLVVISG